MRNTRVSGLRHCNERTNLNMCVNKSVLQVLESSPVVLLVSHRQQRCGNGTAWSHTIFLKTHENIQYIMVVYRHLAVV